MVVGTRLEWHASGLQDQLRALLPSLQVQVMAECGSTNTELLQRAPHDLSPCLLLAETQHQGRGRQGRSWQARPGASLTFSMGLPIRPAQGWGALSLVVGCAVAEALQPWDLPGDPPGHPGRLLLKWPNDLWWFDQAPAVASPSPDGRKVAGVLIETLNLPHDDRRWVVIGVGINVDLPPAEGLLTPPGRTRDWLTEEDAPAVWHRVAPALLRAVLDFESRGFAAWRHPCMARELLIGRRVHLSAGSVSEGLCVGIDHDGALLVQAAQGTVRVSAGEASVRPLSPGTPSAA